MQTHFDHEKLDAYRLELEFVAWAGALLEELDERPLKRRLAEVTDQLDRASFSALLNTAEGNGRRQRRTRAKFFDDARGSATECAACLDALVAKRACEPARIVEGKALRVRIVSILSKLVQMFDEPEALREEPAPYRVGDILD
jgi:four helix bundle protein